MIVGASATWQTLQPLAGDFNLDEPVDELDLNIWMANFGMTSGATFQMGDANHDGAVNGLDLDLWAATQGMVLSAGSPGNGSQVPKIATPLPPAGGATPLPHQSTPLPVSVLPTGNPAVSPRGVDSLPLTVMSAIYWETGKGTLLNPQATLAGGLDLLSVERNQTPSITVTPAKPVPTLYDTSKSGASAAVLSHVLLPRATLQAAHDAVFSQPDNGQGSLVGGLLATGKINSDAGLAAAGIDLGHSNAAKPSTPQPCAGRGSTKT